MYIGVGIGWQRRCKTCQSLRELDNQGTVVAVFCFCFAVTMMVIELDQLCGVENLTPHRGNDRITWCEYGRAPTRQLHSNTHCCLLSGHTRKQSNSLALSSMSKKVGTRCRSPSCERFLEGRMQFTLHATRRTPHSASRLVQAMSAWLVKTRRAPSRHSRDARVYGHTTTTMHKLSTPPSIHRLLSSPLNVDIY